MLRKLIVSIAAIVAAGSVSASDWRQAYVSGDRTVYVDVASYSTAGETTRAWIRQDLTREQIAVTGQTYDALENLVDIDCSRRKASTSDVIGTYHGQKSITFEAAGFEDIAPDTYMSKVAEMICTKPGETGARKTDLNLSPTRIPPQNISVGATHQHWQNNERNT